MAATAKRPPALSPGELRAIVLFNGLLPAGMLIYTAISGSLGRKPVEFVLHATGTLALIFLLLSLTVTPLRRLTGLAVISKLRRMLGLLAFAYACAHFSIYAVLDQGLALTAIGQDIVSRPYITVGFAAFAFMVPLAVTSTAGWVRKLGPRWQKLHRRVYAIAILAVIHYLWSVKADRSGPLLYGAILAVLLGARLLPALQTWRKARHAT